ncbi:hypothetical protein BCR33DRAFT_713873 [Rhizoclosmatium globosum]|uniref:Uncharacterized protein n=1 Tax=Rhizoclosmatium globosum TaxID=329046 RepID=A0A1Y2CRA6_9FUNG|nr:hypothetical protein BCR33DRAFT_713873 [Rhizoclosmatium globosum]|eukprot:ORY49561.1 hypothetical protein BCR33DRAFT_713873 [Rhizoclosmatium globosum]
MWYWDLLVDEELAVVQPQAIPKIPSANIGNSSHIIPLVLHSLFLILLALNFVVENSVVV